MDPQQKQDVKYKTQSIMGSLSDKMDIASTKFRNDEGSKLDVAVLKATLNDEVVPKEKHVVTLKIACGSGHQSVQYVIHSLVQRLEAHKGKWLVTLKALIVFHRLLRETDPSFQEELIRYSEKTGTRRMLRLDTFADHTTKETWDYSAWVRVYSVYLDERLDVYRIMKWDPEQDEKAESKVKACPTAEILERMPSLHKLLSRLIACVPEGCATTNPVTVQACGFVLREVKSVYRLVSEAVMNLADKFFEMDRTEAQQGLELYKENVALNERLNGFFTAINSIGTMKGAVQFPALQSLPTDFLTTMEEYVRDAPRMLDMGGSDPGPAGAKGAAGGPKPLAEVRSSSIVRQGGVTSTAIAGAGAPVIKTVLKIGGPIADGPSSPPAAPEAAPAAPAAAPAAPAAAPLVDLLGDDLGAVSLASQQQPPAEAAAQQQPQSKAGRADSFFSGAWMAEPGATAPAASQQTQPPAAALAPVPGYQQPQQAGPVGFASSPPPAQPQPLPQQYQPFPAAFPPAAGAAPPALPSAHQPQYAGFPAPSHQQQPQQQQQQFGFPQQAPPAYQPGQPAPYSAPPAAPSGFPPGPPPAFPPAASAAYGAPSAAAYPSPYAPPAASPNPYGGVTSSAPAPLSPYGAPPSHPYGSPAPGPAPFNPYASYPPAGAPSQQNNPFASPAATSSPPQPAAPAAWDPNHDPLSNLSMDILGKPSGWQPPQPTLKQMRGNGV